MSKHRPGSKNYQGLDARRWAWARRKAFERDGHRCVKCGKAGRLEGHHEPPLREGVDPYLVAGIVTLCRGCHIAHHRAENDIPGQGAWRRLVVEMAGE